MCSGHGSWSFQGSSPLTRGKPPFRCPRSPSRRLIPAHAGKTTIMNIKYPLAGAHPRSRGENALGRRSRLAGWGSSPLTRGKPGADHGPSVACWAHPRSRGENNTDERLRGGFRGSSPLTRGKRHPRIRLGLPAGLIPAHAGKTQANGFVVSPHEGSSPLTRGKRQGLGVRGANRGLIPAHAGKTARLALRAL